VRTNLAQLRHDYAPTGQTVAQMWNDGDDAVKRGMARALKDSWGMALADRDGQPVLVIGTAGPASTTGPGGIADLGDGLRLPPLARLVAHAQRASADISADARAIPRARLH